MGQRCHISSHSLEDKVPAAGVCKNEHILIKKLYWHPLCQ